MSSDATRTVGAPAATGTAKVGGASTTGRRARVGSVPLSRTKPGTYIAETYTGDLDATMGGSPVVANDGEPAGLARVTLAMRPETTQPPAPGRLVALCAWAALIGIFGLVLAIRSGVAVVAGAPGWFAPIAALVGLVGFAATLGAFITARWQRIPWVLLGVASVTIIVALVLVLNL